MSITVRDHTLGDMIARYENDDVSGAVALTLLPARTRIGTTARRELLEEREILAMPVPWCSAPARRLDSLVQIQTTADERPSGYAQGRTLRNGGTTLALRLQSQEDYPLTSGVGGTAGRQIVTVLAGPHGLRCEHRLSWSPGDAGVRVETRVENRGGAPVSLELLSSFSLDGITPFHRADAPGRLVLHRFRSGWSSEGRGDSQALEALHLERGWQGHSVNVERFGQVGSLPVRGYFPCAVVEDTVAGVSWAAQLAWAGSWQMEVYRQGDSVALSGGLADREFGHWLKNLSPGETLVAPEAWLTVCAGNRDEACARLVKQQERLLPAAPATERELAPIFNEFCSSWGDPDEARVLALADRLAGTPVRYLVIDAGWYADKGRLWFNAHGDWTPGNGRFPQGLAATAKAIRQRGLIPGLWFEWETCGRTSETFKRTDDLLSRDGVTITVADRRFLDLRKPGVLVSLDRRVLARLRDDGFGYVKFDYNETLGLGVDGAESPGEGLRQVIVATNALYAGLAKELPDTVIELCASGGHRLEPSLMRHGHMGSFSDAHETPELPLIAAGLHRLVPVRQLQVWAVLRAEADERRLLYVLAAGFLGRMCLSGDLPALSEEQWTLTKRALDLYAKAAPVLRDGRTHWFGPSVKAWRHPEGWQLIVRVAADGRSALVVGHAFGGGLPEVAECELPGGPWTVDETLAETTVGMATKGSASPVSGAGAHGAAVLTETAAITLVGGRRLVWGVPGAFSAVVTLLKRV